MSKLNNTQNMPKKPASTEQDWHRADVVAAFKKRGTSLYKVSRELGMYPTYLCAAMDRPYPKAERIIAEFLGVTPQTIWPSRYHADGTPRSGRGERGIGRHHSYYTKKHNTQNATQNQLAQVGAN